MGAGQRDEELWSQPFPETPPAAPDSPPPPTTWTPPPSWQPPTAGPSTAPPPPPAPQWVEPPPPPLLPTAVVRLEPTTRKSLVTETRVVLFGFLLIGITGAVVLIAQHVYGVGPVTPFPVLIHHNQVGNVIVGILAYFPTAAFVPIALFLLARTGQHRRDLGLGWPSFIRDVWPALGLIAASFGCEIALNLVLSPLLRSQASLANHGVIGQVPWYYIFYGLSIAATTAINEEVLVNGYLMVRLEQLGWTPGKALALSLTLRTSYHIYYGIGFVLTIPFGYFVTRSFQKNRRLNRSIVTHFLFDAIVFTLAIFVVVKR